MPRTELTKTVALGAYGGAGVAVTMTAADTTNQNDFVAQGKDFIIAQNTGASPHTVTVTSVDDPYGRVEHITAESIAAGAIRIYGPIERLGWQQTDGKIYLEADNAEVFFGIVKLPG